MTGHVTIALAGDTMLGRGVAAVLNEEPERPVVSREVRDVAAEADLFVLNLECCISERGSPWPDPAKPFFFRAPPGAIGVLQDLGVSCVTLANNHALDFGEEALLDTARYLHEAGIGHVGAGPDVESARRPVVLGAGGMRIAVLGVTDHPAEYAAASGRPGVAFADLRRGVPAWLKRSIATADADAVLVTPHWGPNMTTEPPAYVRAGAHALVGVGATLVAGHSAHLFHGVEQRILYDIGDFLDDYAVDPVLRNDLGLLLLVTVGSSGPVGLEAVPLKLDYCFTRLAEGDDAAWIARRFCDACQPFGTEVRYERGRLIVSWRTESGPAMRSCLDNVDTSFVRLQARALTPEGDSYSSEDRLVLGSMPGSQYQGVRVVPVRAPEVAPDSDERNQQDLHGLKDLIEAGKVTPDRPDLPAERDP